MEKLANYLHLPVQSGSDRVLAAMKRGHTVLEYKDKIRRLRECARDQHCNGSHRRLSRRNATTTSQATMQLVADVGFDQSFSFVYSPRPGTPAAALPDPVPREEKLARLARLQDS